MSRNVKAQKPVIFVFCEGESEEAYTNFLKKEFHEVVSIPKVTVGLFEEARDKFSKDRRFRDKADAIDEIWFFFDVEKDQKDKWEERYKIVQQLRKLRKKPNIRVRLLMTTACIEYWMILHYKYCTPHIESVTDKNHILEELRKYEPQYQKGDSDITERIASRYNIALENAPKTLTRLIQDGLPDIKDTDERNQWLYKSDKTFSTVQEAICYLESLKDTSTP